MFSFLHLPRELRDTTLQYAVHIPQSPPPDPWRGPGDRVAAQDVYYQAQGPAPRDVLYQPGGTTPQALLLVNRQVRDETLAILRKITRPSYTVDVIALNQVQLWPTWVSVPVVRTHVDEVRMELRIFGHCLSRHAGLLNRTDPRSGVLEWRFYAMLERFLIHGPLFLPNQTKGSPEDRKFFITTLTINITTCPDAKHRLASNKITAEDYRYWLKYRMLYCPMDFDFDLSDVMPRPEWIASQLSDQIDALLSMEFIRFCHGGVLYEHIGAIRILCDGRVYKELDLAGRLAALRVVDEASVFRYDGRMSFREWKREVLRKRLKAGLPVIR